MERLYKEGCANGAFESGGALHASVEHVDDDEMDGQGEKGEAGQAGASKSACFNLLQQVVSETKAWASDAQGASDALPAEDAAPTGADHHDLKGIPDPKEFQALLTATNSKSPFGADALGSHHKDEADRNYMPNTLFTALAIKGNSRQELFNKLLRLCITLRCCFGGADTGFLRNPLMCRKVARKLNWHQHFGSKCRGWDGVDVGLSRTPGLPATPLRYNEHVLAMMNWEKEDGEYKSRTSRLQKWKDMAQQASKELEVSMAFPDKLMYLGRMNLVPYCSNFMHFPAL